MSDPGYLLGVYLHLARASQQRNRPHVTDRLLTVAAATASEMGLQPVADYCRSLVLAHNPHHMLRRWPTVRAALEQEPFQGLLKQLRRRYPMERAERLLESLDLQLGHERDAYFSDYEYAAALLGTTPAQLDRQFPE